MENITGMILVVICLPLAFGYYEGWGLPNGQVVSCRWPTSYLPWRCVPVVYDATCKRSSRFSAAEGIDVSLVGGEDLELVKDPSRK